MKLIPTWKDKFQYDVLYKGSYSIVHHFFSENKAHLAMFIPFSSVHKIYVEDFVAAHKTRIIFSFKH